MDELKIEFCEFPDDLLYDLENNVWVKLTNGYAEFGITSVHASFSGRLKDLKFTKPVMATVTRGQSVATIESMKYFGAVRAPLSGVITELNQNLLRVPKLANDSPYQQGWFAKIKTQQQPTEESNGLRNLRSIQDEIRQQIHQLHARCFKAYPDHDLWEIGIECGAVLVRLNELMDRSEVGEVFHIVSDDPTADIEMIRWSDQTGQEILESRQEGNLIHFIVKKVK